MTAKEGFELGGSRKSRGPQIRRSALPAGSRFLAALGMAAHGIKIMPWLRAHGTAIVPWLLLLAGTPPLRAAIARDGNCGAATTSCTFSATATGDLKIIFAFDSGSTTIPSVPAGWTNIAGVATSNGGTTAAWRMGCNVSSSSSDTGSGTWTNATDVVGISYSGTAVGTTANCNTTGAGAGNSSNAKTSTSASFPGFTLTHTDGTSWVAGFMGGTATSGTVVCTPSGMTQVTTGGTGPEAEANDTNGGVSTWSSQSCTVASETWMSSVREVLAPSSCGAGQAIALLGVGCR